MASAANVSNQDLRNSGLQTYNLTANYEKQLVDRCLFGDLGIVVNFGNEKAIPNSPEAVALGLNIQITNCVTTGKLQFNFFENLRYDFVSVSLSNISQYSIPSQLTYRSMIEFAIRGIVGAESKIMIKGVQLVLATATLQQNMTVVSFIVSSGASLDSNILSVENVYLIGDAAPQLSMSSTTELVAVQFLVGGLFLSNSVTISDILLTTNASGWPLTMTACVSLTHFPSATVMSNQIGIDGIRSVGESAIGIINQFIQNGLDGSLRYEANNITFYNVSTVGSSSRGVIFDFQHTAELATSPPNSLIFTDNLLLIKMVNLTAVASEEQYLSFPWCVHFNLNSFMTALVEPVTQFHSATTQLLFARNTIWAQNISIEGGQITTTTPPTTNPFVKPSAVGITLNSNITTFDPQTTSNADASSLCSILFTDNNLTASDVSLSGSHAHAAMLVNVSSNQGVAVYGNQFDLIDVRVSNAPFGRGLFFVANSAAPPISFAADSTVGYLSSFVINNSISVRDISSRGDPSVMSRLPAAELSVLPHSLSSFSNNTVAFTRISYGFVASNDSLAPSAPVLGYTGQTSVVVVRFALPLALNKLPRISSPLLVIGNTFSILDIRDEGRSTAPQTVVVSAGELWTSASKNIFTIMKIHLSGASSMATTIRFYFLQNCRWVGNTIEVGNVTHTSLMDSAGSSMGVYGVSFSAVSGSWVSSSTFMVSDVVASSPYSMFAVLFSLVGAGFEDNHIAVSNISVLRTHLLNKPLQSSCFRLDSAPTATFYRNTIVAQRLRNEVKGGVGALLTIGAMNTSAASPFDMVGDAGKFKSFQELLNAYPLPNTDYFLRPGMSNCIAVRHVVITGNGSVGAQVLLSGVTANLTLTVRDVASIPGVVGDFGGAGNMAVYINIVGPVLFSRIRVSNISHERSAAAHFELGPAVVMYIGAISFVRSNISVHLLRVDGLNGHAIATTFYNSNFSRSLLAATDILLTPSKANIFAHLLLITEAFVTDSGFIFRRLSSFASSDGLTSSTVTGMAISLVKSTFSKNAIAVTDIDLRLLNGVAAVFQVATDTSLYSKAVSFIAQRSTVVSDLDMTVERISSNITGTVGLNLDLQVPLLTSTIAAVNVSTKLGIGIRVSTVGISDSKLYFDGISSSVVKEWRVDVQQNIESLFVAASTLSKNDNDMLDLLEMSVTRDEVPSSSAVITYFLSPDANPPPQSSSETAAAPPSPFFGERVSPNNVICICVHVVLSPSIVLARNTFLFTELRARFGPLIYFVTKDDGIGGALSPPCVIRRNVFVVHNSSLVLTDRSEYSDAGFISGVGFAALQPSGFTFDIRQMPGVHSLSFDLNAFFVSNVSMTYNMNSSQTFSAVEVGIAAFNLGIHGLQDNTSAVICQNITLHINDCTWDLPPYMFMLYDRLCGFVGYVELPTVSQLSFTVQNSNGSFNMTTESCSHCIIDVASVSVSQQSAYHSAIKGSFTDNSLIAFSECRFSSGMLIIAELNRSTTLAIRQSTISVFFKTIISVGGSSAFTIVESSAAVWADIGGVVHSGSKFVMSRCDIASLTLGVSSGNCSIAASCLITLENSKIMSGLYGLLWSGSIDSGGVFVVQGNTINARGQSIAFRISGGFYGSAVVSILTNAMSTTTRSPSQVFYCSAISSQFVGAFEIWGNSFTGPLFLTIVNNGPEARFRIVSNLFTSNSFLADQVLVSTTTVPGEQYPNRLFACNALLNASMKLSLPATFSSLECTPYATIRRCTDELSVYWPSGINRTERLSHREVQSCVDEPARPQRTRTLLFSNSPSKNVVNATDSQTSISATIGATTTKTIMVSRSHLSPQLATDRPLVPVPAVVETAKQVKDAASVVVAVTAVASVTGGQLGVANAMIRLADCTDSEDGEDSLPILVHPLQFKFGDRSYQKNAAGAISNTLLVPLIVTLIALGPVRLLIMRFRAVPSRIAMAQMGWPSLLIMPFTNLAEGIGTTIGNALASGEPFGIGIGFVAGAILVAFVGSWVWMLVRLVPRRRLALRQEEGEYKHIVLLEGGSATNSFSARRRKRRDFFFRIVRPTHRWMPLTSEDQPALRLNHVERYSNAIGDKQWYYAEFLSFLCSVAVGLAESLPSTVCRERVVIALVPALLQCGLAVLALIPLERFLQSLLALCLVPMYIVVAVKVFTDKSDGDELLDSAMAVFSSASNVIGIFIMCLSLIMGVWEIVTTHSTGKKRAAANASETINDLRLSFAMNTPMLEVAADTDRPASVHAPSCHTDSEDEPVHSQTPPPTPPVKHGLSPTAATASSAFIPIQQSRSIEDVLDFVERAALEQHLLTREEL